MGLKYSKFSNKFLSYKNKKTDIKNYLKKPIFENNLKNLTKHVLITWGT